VIVKGTGQQFALMYLAALNPNMTAEQITEYLERVIRPRMSTIPGVAEIEIIGAAELRHARLDRPAPARRARRHGLEVLQAISASNFLSAPGATGERVRRLQHHAGVDAPDAEAFGALPLKARATRWCGCATWRASSSPPRRRTRSSPSTASPAPSSASSPRPPPTRSTPPTR
jgi:multidrug efflux pump